MILRSLWRLEAQKNLALCALPTPSVREQLSMSRKKGMEHNVMTNRMLNAAEALADVTEKYPMLPPPGRATVHWNCGVALFQRKDHEAALKHFDEASKLCDPVPYQVISNRSAALSKLGRLDEGLAEAKKCMLLRPDIVTGFLWYAVGLHEMARAGKQSWPDVMAAYQHVLQMAPGHKLAQLGRDNCVRERMDARRRLHASATHVIVRLVLAVIPTGVVGHGQRDCSAKRTGVRVLAACRAAEVPVEVPPPAQGSGGGAVEGEAPVPPAVHIS